MLFRKRRILTSAFLMFFASVTSLSAMKRRFGAIGQSVRECELMQAIASQEYERARAIINQAPIDLNNYMHNPVGMTALPLMSALRSSISPYSHDVEKNVGLIKKKRDFIAFLLEKGANPNKPLLDNITYELKKDLTLLDRVLSVHNPGYKEIAKLLLLYGARTKKNKLSTHFSLEEMEELEAERAAQQDACSKDRSYLQGLHSAQAGPFSYEAQYDPVLHGFLAPAPLPDVLADVIQGYHKGQGVVMKKEKKKMMTVRRHA